MRHRLFCVGSATAATSLHAAALDVHAQRYAHVPKADRTLDMHSYGLHAHTNSNIAWLYAAAMQAIKLDYHAHSL
jgi:hypothetical protein